MLPVQESDDGKWQGRDQFSNGLPLRLKQVLQMERLQTLVINNSLYHDQSIPPIPWRII